MNMISIEEIQALIILWAPSLAAVISTVFGTVFALIKCRKAVADIRANEEIKQLKEEVKRQNEVNSELVAKTDLLLDNITKIKGYSSTHNNMGGK